MGTVTLPEKCITRWIPHIIDSLSFVTCQYIRPVNDRAKENCPARCSKCSWCCSTQVMIVLIAVFAIFAIMISIFPACALLAGWIECPYQYGTYDICFTLKQHGSTPLLKATTTDNTTKESSLKNDVNTMEVQRLVDLSKISLLFLITASGVSQVFFFWALWCLFIKHYKWPDNKCTKGWKKFKSYFCCIRDNDYDSTKPLDPFDDDVENEVFEPSSIVEVYQHKEENDISFFEKQDDRTNTPLQGERLCHYIVLFAIALILLIITASLFLVAQYAEASKDVLPETTFKWESVAVASEIYSLFRSLVSCFIFSKLMYGIQRKCEELEMFVFYVDDNYNKLLPQRNNEPQERNNEQPQERNNEQPQERNNEQPQERNNVYKYVDNLFEEIQDGHQQSRYSRIADGDSYISKKINKEKEKTLNDEKALAFKYLDERDKHFVKKAVVTLNWLQLWFLLHWLLHIISTFMVIALLIDAVTLHVKAKIPHANRGAKIYPEEIWSLFMSSLMQCFFLFYPCLRAASVTRTRQRVIREISENIGLFENIPPEVLNEFIESMKRRRFGFRLRIFCAKMQFNMNIAYLSIGFGFVGIVFSLILN